MSNAASKPSITDRAVRLLGRLINAEWYKGLVVLEAMRHQPQVQATHRLSPRAVEALESAIVGLPEPHMHLLILFIYEDYSVGRLARIFGLTPARTISIIEEALDMIDSSVKDWRFCGAGINPTDYAQKPGARSGTRSDGDRRGNHTAAAQRERQRDRAPQRRALSALARE